MTKNHDNLAITAIYISILSNTMLSIVKWLAGYFGNSYALIADAIESTTDALASLLVLAGLKYTTRPADDNHPYGHGRAEPLITFIVVAFMVASAITIIYNSIINIITPHSAPERFTLWVLAAIIIWKELSFRIVVNRARHTNSSSLMADAWHHRTDCITSIAAFIGIALSLSGYKFFAKADDYAAIVASIIILYNSYRIFRPALGEIMDEHLYDELIEQIRSISLTVPGIKSTEKCFIRKSGMHYHVELHAWVDGEITVRKGHELAHNLKDVLKARIPELDHVLIHIEPYNPNDRLSLA
jgi:cation diffusion facilitator family transporter